MKAGNLIIIKRVKTSIPEITIKLFYTILLFFNPLSIFKLFKKKLQLPEYIILY